MSNVLRASTPALVTSSRWSLVAKVAAGLAVMAALITLVLVTGGGSTNTLELHGAHGGKIGLPLRSRQEHGLPSTAQGRAVPLPAGTEHGMPSADIPRPAAR
ncbi:MAG: hypothetical protein ACXVRH_05480 [Thermoleophilaceae bacterium]